MSRSLNQCNFIGNLGNDPESKSMPNGTAVTNISIAVSDDYKDKNTGQNVEQTEWVRVSAFGKLAEIMAEYLKKGSKVYISGKMKTRSWDKDGVKQYSTEIVANDMLMLDSRGNAQSSQTQQGQASQSSQPTSMDDFVSDLPF